MKIISTDSEQLPTRQNFVDQTDDKKGQGTHIVYTNEDGETRWCDKGSFYNEFLNSKKALQVYVWNKSKVCDSRIYKEL